MKFKRRQITMDEKIKIIAEIESGRSMTVVGRQFDLKYQTVNKIWQRRNEINKELDREINKPVEAAVEEELLAWFEHEVKDESDLSEEVLAKKAEEIIGLFGCKFDCDVLDWVDEFAVRHDINLAKEEEGDAGSLHSENVDGEQSSDEESALRCFDCDVSFTSKYYLYNHLVHHVKQPVVQLRRCDADPIKITLKNTQNNNFQVITSPKIAEQQSDGEAADRADVAGTPDDVDNVEDALPIIEEIDSEMAAELEEAAANVNFSPNYITSDSIEDISEVRDAMTPTTDGEKSSDCNSIPGAEPTPPPEPSPEYPKIRIKTGLLKDPVKESLTITEITDDNPNGDYNSQSSEYQNIDNFGTWATPSLEDPLRLPDASDNDSNLLSNLFSNNNDRAKDLGFTTSDTEFIAMDSTRSSTSNALAVFNSSANSMVSSNPLDTLTNLPMQQLAQQVSRLQPNGSGGMHQQNVLINIQQFPQAPPQPHAYQPHMYPPHPPQPMYHQPYQPYHYQTTQQLVEYLRPPPNPMYYPQAPPAYPPHMPPPPPRPQIAPQMPPPQQQQQNSQQPPAYRQQSPARQQTPMGAPRQQVQQGQRGGMQPRGGVQMGPRQFGSRAPMAARPRAPMIRGRGGGVMMGGPRGGMRPRMPMQNGQAQAQQNGPRMIKRTPEQIQALQAKKRKMDVLVPDKHDDADCQVIAVQPKNTGLPQIQSIQGNAPEPTDNSIMHLSDSITLSVRNPPPKPASPKKSDAKDVANILATRGITVTATQKSKEAMKSSSKSPEPAGAATTPVAINLNSAVCIIPTKNKEGMNGTKPSADNNKMATVDLTDDIENHSSSQKQILQQRLQQQPHQQQQQHQQQSNKVLPFQCDLCPAKYTNPLNLNKHRQSYHKTGPTADFGVPLVDLKAPGVVQRLSAMGIHHYIPLPGANTDTTFALPIINANAYKNGNLATVASSVLTLGPVRMLPKPATPNNMHK